MKLVKGISIFFIAFGLFIVGCFMGFTGHNFFYPGEAPAAKAEGGSSSVPGGEMQVSAVEKNMISADTSFFVTEINMADQSEITEEIPVPVYYMGMDREAFERQIQDFNSSPSLQELQKGFQGSEIRSFSGNRVELCKYYQDQAEEEEEYYYLAVRKNKVVVYRADGQTIYMETDIPAEDLPADILIDLLQTRVVDTEEDLYDFLESYSS